ncbi:hypothetical protein Droror1_Dr00016524, partial [Drosera rotundifolia]
MWISCIVRLYWFVICDFVGVGKSGSDSVIVGLCSVNFGIRIDPKKAYAEFWIGTHKSGPSFVVESERDLVNGWCGKLRFGELICGTHLEVLEQCVGVFVGVLNCSACWNGCCASCSPWFEVERLGFVRGWIHFVQIGSSYEFVIGEYVAHNDAILLEVIPATQTQKISSSKALRKAKEHDSEDSSFLVSSRANGYESSGKEPSRSHEDPLN